MFQMERYFHYRNLEVNTVKVLARRWYPNLAQGFKKTATWPWRISRHSIDRRYYRAYLFIKPGIGVF